MLGLTLQGSAALPDVTVSSDMVDLTMTSSDGEPGTPVAAAQLAAEPPAAPKKKAKKASKKKLDQY
jgi:hypothetical protein